MELRKVEQELEHLSLEWMTLRRKRPRFDDVSNGVSGNSSREGVTVAVCDNAVTTFACGSGISVDGDSNLLPSWKELTGRLDDDEIFSSEKNDEICVEADGADANHESNVREVLLGGTSTASACDKGQTSLSEKDVREIPNDPALIRKQSSSQIEKVGVVELEEEESIPEPTSPQHILDALESLRDSVSMLRPRIDRFLVRLAEVSHSIS